MFWRKFCVHFCFYAYHSYLNLVSQLGHLFLWINEYICFHPHSGHMCTDFFIGISRREPLGDQTLLSCIAPVSLILLKARFVLLAPHTGQVSMSVLLSVNRTLLAPQFAQLHLIFILALFGIYQPHYDCVRYLFLNHTFYYIPIPASKTATNSAG
jgi:hypothetical protein